MDPIESLRRFGWPLRQSLHGYQIDVARFPALKSSDLHHLDRVDAEQSPRDSVIWFRDDAEMDLGTVAQVSVRTRKGFGSSPAINRSTTSSTRAWARTTSRRLSCSSRRQSAVVAGR